MVKNMEKVYLSNKVVNQNRQLYQHWFKYKNFDFSTLSNDDSTVDNAYKELAKIPKLVTVLIQNEDHNLTFDLKDIYSLVTDNYGIIKEITLSNGDRLMCNKINEDYIVYGYTN
jgi:hypothetical protein